MHNETDEEVRADRNAQEAAERGAFAPAPRKAVKGYKIVNAHDPRVLEKLVMALVEVGWVPLGGVSFWEAPDAFHYHQAMVLR